MKISGSSLVADGGVEISGYFLAHVPAQDSRSESPCFQVPQHGQRIVFAAV
jgi:hypothetical protein